LAESLNKVRPIISIVCETPGNLLVPAPTAARASITHVTRTGDLDRSLAVGIAWTAAAKWSSQLISWTSFVIVTRLLAPSDFGLVGMAALYCGLLQLVTDAFGAAVTTHRDLTGEQLAQLNTVALLSGFLACLISCGLAIPLGHFFRSPHLPLIVVVMSAAFLVSGLRTVPYSLLYKDMRFRLLSILEAVQTVAQALTMLIFAWLGFRYWALVLGSFAGAATLAALQISWRPCRFATPRFSSIKNALTFSRHIMVSNLSWYGYSNADFLVAGRVLGQAALGAYTLAWSLATIPLEKVTAIVTNVSYAYFSAAQNDNAALRRYLRILTEGVSIVTFPATLGLGLVAGDFVHLVLGAKWQGAIAPLEILAVYATFRCIVAFLPSILNVAGESRFVMRITQAALILMPIAFFVGSRWGPIGIACGWVAAYPVLVVCLYRRTFRRIDMHWRDYLGAIRPALISSLIMVAVVEILKRTLVSSAPLSVRFGLEVVAGGAAYVLTLTVFHRDRFFVFWNFVRALRDPLRVNAAVEQTARL
jgi:O-antigen/teichoic acid export membrane protein